MSIAFWISAISIFWSRSTPAVRMSRSLIRPRFLDAALGGDAGAFDLLAGGDLGLLERLALGDLQCFEMPLALEPDLVEGAVLRDPRGLGLLVLDDLGAALFGLRLGHFQRLLGERDLALQLDDLERFLALRSRARSARARARSAPFPATVRARSARARSARASSSRPRRASGGGRSRDAACPPRS